MGVYDGLTFLRRSRTRIVFRNTVPRNARIVYSSSPDFKYDVELNEKDSLDRQVFFLIHEAIHCGEGFIKFFGKMRHLPQKEYSEIETQIDKETSFVYENHKRLVDFLKGTLNKEPWYEMGERYYKIS